MAMGYLLHNDIGKVPAVLLAQSGIVVTTSAITQDAMRRAECPVGAAYQELRLQIGPSRPGKGCVEIEASIDLLLLIIQARREPSPSLLF